VEFGGLLDLVELRTAGDQGLDLAQLAEDIDQAEQLTPAA
jgi:hypothetical protein